MIVQAILAGFLAGAGLIVAIGAQNAFVLRQGLKRQHVGLVVTICVLGDIALILLGVAGIGVLVQQWSGLLQLLRYAGAAFLAVYGWMAAGRAWRGDAAMAPAEQGEEQWQRAMLTGLAFTFLNPHVYLDTMVLLGSLSTHYPGALRWTFALGACLASVIWFCSLGYGARLLQPVFRHPRAWRVLDGLIAVFMLLLCVLLLLPSHATLA
ncbi:LysE/ArgO family amino acid transporter [Xanthomonas prunicola]|uniref:LysE/ArgO family amino acid transporter n=1 Tax=Xanthomonas prunicola TaxID=2053930 RepID=A0A9Q9IXA4_9XANT|nr:LysE/ArgO family amino acid transporter [Xanthomonas prunicola]USI99564.1 LysE/ArgO family amino acid transporter [Xanthomonas prunicola]UXA48017.1 LysE/ArgO family amino acid transporter [Xanthomonas prunicola]UXA54145.1 LysE/ArgO family amino acid transporter [Xanthomonas prunicola]UXA56482.1 LysE/ArgO family amino acid transporter [Xanthomonas prunicola]UXA62439.1 LysE/ArgO family amino acid transporter [Xanthomonas prunicola]